ncbi:MULTISPECIES: hypothetical protein [unclassified Paenibacillus]|uniref:hypothetical protein n=1 Tax=unclassified Paenibacillus TaxID=185978 RepID=UPI0024076C4F|nr:MULTISPECIES: hypothetical protein [unclassified Paenibacillus]MDF9839199.1 hypothetical protein [Paenibacillus sp. PastF-2]MDF9845781.1 hypothetical protein [Paenibacillus sp. PastM-2]MDF9852353.1 hypothetical protein [Paenibacillus sp. PastF-1]MDH6477917.1 hypothetical protein [Paenibacillus sp. PastH-2]MDH6505655.1 hypothetical protein [Paenibacillus sp. PastM-3]
MKYRIMGVIESRYGLVRRTRRRVSLDQLEEAVISTYEYRSDYDGLTVFAAAVEQLLKEGYFIKLTKSRLYGTTRIAAAYWLPETTSTLTLVSMGRLNSGILICRSS